MSLTLSFIIILILHFVGDFILQSNEMATRKSSSNLWLLRHVSTYIAPFYFMFFVFGSFSLTLLFMGINGVMHFFTDYASSRMAKYFREKEDWHNFFIIIGADQMVHMITLLLTFVWLSGV